MCFRGERAAEVLHAEGGINDGNERLDPLEQKP